MTYRSQWHILGDILLLFRGNTELYEGKRLKRSQTSLGCSNVIPVSVSVLAWPSSKAKLGSVCPSLSPIRMLSLDLGPTLIQCALVSILTVIIYVTTLFLNKITFLVSCKM